MFHLVSKMARVVAHDDLQLALAMSLSELPQKTDKIDTCSTPVSSEEVTGSTYSTPDVSGDSNNSLISLPPIVVVIDPQRPLKSMGQSGLIPFGKKVLRMSYKQYEFFVDVNKDGVITESGGDGKQYYNPSSFSLAMKRSINPKIVADSGWESLRYNGRKLSHIRDGIETVMRKRKLKHSKDRHSKDRRGGKKLNQQCVFKGIDRKKEALVKQVITHYKAAEVEDNEKFRQKRRLEHSRRNYDNLAKVSQGYCTQRFPVLVFN